MSNEFDQSPNKEALTQIGLLIDRAVDEGKPELTTQAFEIIETLEDHVLEPQQGALLHYFKSNAWGNRIQEQGRQNSWNWEHTERQNQLLELRRALNHEGFKLLDTIRQCQIYTNLANELNTIGRSIEAIAYWDRALDLEPRFAMANANRGIGFKCYAYSIYDLGHKALLMLAAHDALGVALAPNAIYESPNKDHLISTFEQKQQEIIRFIDLTETRALLDSTEWKLVGPKEQVRYKQWCLNNRLYINPLNDIGAYEIACHDVMTLPSIKERFNVGSSGPPTIIGFYNQLKQEYVSARFLLFEACHNDDAHYSDEDVLLYNSLDYPSYGLATEKLRIVYRMVYSLFDKMAFGINRYFELAHKDHAVTFRGVWYMPGKQKEGIIHGALENHENWPLRGLFWLAKDFYEDEFKSSTEPDASQIADIRNYLEHKFLKIRLTWAGPIPDLPSRPDDWAYQITRKEFEAKTLKLMQLARAALIYFSNAIHQEESSSAREQGDGITATMYLDRWDDEWKI